MGVFVRIRGWLECDNRQLDLVKEIIGSGDPFRTYSGGWAFPTLQYNWTNWAFFGATMREQSVDEFLELLRLVARIPASDEDNDLVIGLFLVSHEVEGLSEWQVRKGTVVIGKASGEYQYLEE